MSFESYLLRVSEQNIVLADLPEEQQATEGSLLYLEAVIAKHTQNNERTLSQSETLAARTTLR